MNIYLHYLWQNVNRSLWFLPALGVVTGLALAVGAVALDRTGLSARWGELYWLLFIDAGGARQTLDTIAGSMITVISLVGSLTLLTMSLAATQLGPRLLQLFAADRVTQVVIAQFLGTFVFAVAVMRAVDARPENPFVPHFSVLLALGGTLVSLLMLVVFIHHLARFMQADSVLVRLSEDLMRSIRGVFPAEARGGERDDDEPTGRGSTLVPASRTGYVQRVDLPALVGAARRQGAVVDVLRPPGDFVVIHTALFRVHRPDALPEKAGRRLARHVVLGRKRTAAQDIAFAANTLVEVALRALSPSINDYRTPNAALDLLGAAMIEALRRAEPPYLHRDRDGVARVRMQPTRFDVLADIALSDIRSCSEARPAVLRSIAHTIGTVASHAGQPYQKAVLRRHLRMLARAGRRSLREPDERRRLAGALCVARRRLMESSGADASEGSSS